MSWDFGMPNEHLLFPMSEESQQASTNPPEFWRPSREPEEGQEGVTPYLQQQQFPKTEDVVNSPGPNVDTALIFDNMDDAVDWRRKRRAFEVQSVGDVTLPRNSRQKRAAVKLVFKAFKSVALATDNAGMLKTFLEQKHDNRHVELVCWEVVEACMDRCTHGPLLTAFDVDKAKHSVSMGSFAERLDAVIEALSQQKTICKHLLDAPYLDRFLDDPVGSKQRVESNRKLNKRKGGVMDVGKRALGMSSKRGRPSERQSDVGSGEEVSKSRDGSVPQAQDDTSGDSGPFNSPEQPTLLPDIRGTPPRIGKMGRNSSVGLLEARLLQAAQNHQYGNPGVPSSDRGVGPRPTTGIPPAYRATSGLPAYSTDGSTIDLGANWNNPYLTHPTPRYEITYPNTSHPRLSTSAPMQLYDGYRGYQAPSPHQSIAGNNESVHPGGEGLPDRSDKRRWQQ